MSRRSPLRLTWLALAVLALVTLPARPAGAHAALVSSNPEPGERLSSAPGVVVLRFGEPLVERLSRATVNAPNGDRFEARPAEGGGGAIRVPMRTNAPGVYEVRWRTVSPLDGHTLDGGFRFGVGVDVDPGISGAEGTPGRSDLVAVPFRFVEDAALLFVLGASLLVLLARREPRLSWVAPAPRAAALVALGAGLVVVGAEAFTAADGWSLAGLSTYLTAGRGTARLARLVAEAAVLVAALARRPALTGLASAGALAALAASGHAGAVQPSWWGTLVQSLHLVAAGLWAGGIIRLATLRPSGGWRGETVPDLLRRFTPIALPAFVATAAFGALRGAEELARVSDLWSSSYGAALAVKVTAVAAMVPLSVRAWRLRLAVPRTEALFGAVAIVMAALLAAFPLPPRRVAEAEAASAAAAPSPAIPRAGDLAFGLTVGDELVGLTVRPGVPGSNDLYLHLPSAETGGPTPTVQLVVGRERVRLEGCGLACRHAEVDLVGGEVVRVHVKGDFKEGDDMLLPELPAADGARQLRRLSERMEALRTYHVEETFGPVDPPLLSTYDFEAPDRMHFTVTSTGQETVRIGGLVFSRSGMDATWERRKAPPIDVHEFLWDQPRQRAVHLVGREDVGGIDTQVVALFATTAGGTPLWFRLWVDGEGLVRRALMLADGHFMEHRYSAFDEAIEVEAPSDASAGS